MADQGAWGAAPAAEQAQAATPATSTTQNIAAAHKAASESIRGLSGECWVTVTRLINFINAVLIIAAGVLSFTQITGFGEQVFVGLYCVLFGSVMMLFELRLESSELFIRRYFGFLYNFLGRLLFIFFIATACFTIDGQWRVFGVVVGVITIVNALFNCYILMVHEDFGLAMEASLGLDGTTTKAMANAANAPAASAAANAPMGFTSAQPQPSAAVSGAISAPAAAATRGEVEENPFTTGDDSAFADSAGTAAAATGGALATSAYTGGAGAGSGTRAAGTSDNPFASDSFA